MDTTAKYHFVRPVDVETYWDFNLHVWVEGTHCHLLDDKGSSPCKLQEGHIPGCFR